mgnify:CR=1 FL=1|jgi:hypothetical protein
MNYKSIATTVYTPLELGTVGLTEEGQPEGQGKHTSANGSCYIGGYKQDKKEGHVINV